MKLPNGSELLDATATHNAAEWHEARKTHLGGSDIASILGVGWRSPLEVYGEKLGLLESTPGDRRMESAQFLEPIVAQWFEKATGLVTQETGALVGPGIMMSTPDRLVMNRDDGDQPVAILEIKCPGAHKIADWAADDAGQPQVPQYAVIQASWYALHWELSEVAVQALVGGVFGDPAWLTRDTEFESWMMEAADDFWKNFVLKKIEPPATGTPACRRAILAMHPEHTEDIRVATEAEAMMIHDFRELREAAKGFEDRLDIVKNLVRQAIGGDLGIVSSEGKITHRKSKDGTAIDWEGVAREIAMRIPGAIPGVIPADAIAAYTHPKPGQRRLLLSAAKRK